MSFRVGDVVVRKRSGSSVRHGVATALDTAIKGRVCRVVSPGLSYKVIYQGMSYCILQFDNSLLAASLPGPRCPQHPTC